MPVSGETGRGEYSARRIGPVVPGLLLRPGKVGGGGGYQCGRKRPRRGRHGGGRGRKVREQLGELWPVGRH